MSRDNPIDFMNKVITFLGMLPPLAVIDGEFKTIRLVGGEAELKTLRDLGAMATDLFGDEHIWLSAPYPRVRRFIADGKTEYVVQFISGDMIRAIKYLFCF